MVDVKRAISTSYWFDDDDNNDYDKVITEDMNDDIIIIPPSKRKKFFEYRTNVLFFLWYEDEVIPDGSMTTREHINSSTSLSGHQQLSLTSSHQQPSVMSDSGFLSTLRNYFS